MSYISGTQSETIVDGLGLRFSIYLSGCTHYCKSCHNPETWNFKNGEEFTDELFEKIKSDIRKSYKILDGITLSGGDPLHPDNIETSYYIINELKKEFPKLNYWVYTGYSFEDLKKDNHKILQEIDILVDGEFKEELKDLSLKFIGSSNQRIIKCKESLKSNELILLNLDNY